MNNTMPEEQIEFIENISNYMKASNNMSTGEAYYFAFKVWQNERFFKELFGYNKAIGDFVKLSKEHDFKYRAYNITDCVIGFIEFFAEQLKGGVSK